MVHFEDKSTSDTITVNSLTDAQTLQQHIEKSMELSRRLQMLKQEMKTSEEFLSKKSLLKQKESLQAAIF